MQRLLPPTLVLLLLVASVLIGVVLPIVGPWTVGLRLAGGAVALAGGVLTFTSAGRFSSIGTNIKTFDIPGTLVETGSFAWTRNPMYLGFTALLAGVAGVVGTLSAAVGPVVFWAASNWWYIPFEEERMAETFGSEYEAYRRRVARWVGVPARRERDRVKT